MCGDPMAWALLAGLANSDSHTKRSVFSPVWKFSKRRMRFPSASRYSLAVPSPRTSTL